MTTTSSILGIVPGLQATAIVSKSLGLVKAKKKIKPIKIIKVGVATLIGISLLKPTAKMINAL